MNISYSPANKYNLIDTLSREVLKKGVELSVREAQILNYALSMNATTHKYILMETISDFSRRAVDGLAWPTPKLS